MKLNTPKIDSLRLILPFNEVQVNQNHSTFLRTLTTINEDGEILDSKQNNTYRLHSNPCSSTYLRATTIIQGNALDVLKIGFSTKVLKEAYFDGINASNIDRIHKFILDENVITITKEALLNARVVDVDICMDVLLMNTTTDEAVNYVKTLSIPHKETNVNHFSQKHNIGIEFGDRNKVGKAYKTKQYLKYYSKAIELKHNSTAFYNSHIKDVKELKPFLQDKHLLRIETTVKNNAHWNTYGTTIITLKDLLNLDLTKHLELFKRPISHYMTGSKFIESRTSLTPTDRKDLKLIEMYIKFYDLTEIEAIEYLAKEIEPIYKTNRSRYVKRLKTLVDANRKNKIIKGDINQLNIIEELTKLDLIP